MLFFDHLSRAIACLAIGAVAVAPPSLLVETAPSTPRPYVLPNLKGDVVNFGGLVIRTLVSNTTSEGTLSVMSANTGPGPINIYHYHTQVEAFYILKGTLQVWYNTDQGREMRANDFSLLAPGNNHTYRPDDMDLQLSLCLAPGGVDKFFAALGSPYDSTAPFSTTNAPALNVTKVLATMPEYGIIPKLDDTINLNWTNGTTMDGLTTWDRSEQSIPSDKSKAYWISSNRGPKYLHRDPARVIAKLASFEKPGNGLSISTITIAPTSKPLTSIHFNIHQALQVTEGQLMLDVEGYECASLIFGDLVFIPKGTKFRYWSVVGFTKFINFAAGVKSLAEGLTEAAEPWDYAVWPSEARKSSAVHLQSRHRA